jgi:hypothetical protein
VKIKKTMTEKAIAANQINGPKSNGPNDPIPANQHALKHGLASKYLAFQNEEEQQEFDALLNELVDEYQPVGRTGVELVNKVAVDFWKLAEGNGWEMQALAHRRQATAAIMTTLAENYDGEQLPLFSERDGSHSAVQLGWDCQELVVRTGTRNSEEEEQEISKDRRGKVGHVQIEARLNTSLDTMLRYQAAINRDLYRALGELRSMQRERREREGQRTDQSPRTVAEKED